ncbi:unnamed protein product [Lactuca saligna]|nr:unnamed protein product [Lactuca saligna]
MIKNKVNAISEVWEPVENKTWYYKACTNCFGKAVPSDGSDDRQPTSYRGDSLDFYPDEINALKGLKLAFKVSVTNFNVSKKNNQYGIARISEDASIIEQLQTKLNDSQPSNEQSLDFGSADLQSQDIKNAKDAISGTDDNITPSTLDKNETTSPMKTLTTTPILKRNLKEVLDLECNDHLSSTKTPKISPDGPTKQLLKVKLKKND